MRQSLPRRSQLLCIATTGCGCTTGGGGCFSNSARNCFAKSSPVASSSQSSSHCCASSGTSSRASNAESAGRRKNAAQEGRAGRACQKGVRRLLREEDTPWVGVLSRRGALRGRVAACTACAPSASNSSNSSSYVPRRRRRKAAGCQRVVASAYGLEANGDAPPPACAAPLRALSHQASAALPWLFARAKLCVGESSHNSFCPFSSPISVRARSDLPPRHIISASASTCTFGIGSIGVAAVQRAYCCFSTAEGTAATTTHSAAAAHCASAIGKASNECVTTRHAGPVRRQGRRPRCAYAHTIPLYTALNSNGNSCFPCGQALESVSASALAGALGVRTSRAP